MSRGSVLLSRILFSRVHCLLKFSKVNGRGGNVVYIANGSIIHKYPRYRQCSSKALALTIIERYTAT